MAGQGCTLFTDSRGLSPVVGEFLLIAVTVLLAASLGAVAMSFNTTPEPAPNAAFNIDYVGDANGQTSGLTITHTHGDVINASNLHVKDSHGNRVSWTELTPSDDTTVSAGDSVLIDGQGDDTTLVTPDVAEHPKETYYLIWESDDGRTFIIAEYTLPDN